MAIIHSAFAHLLAEMTVFVDECGKVRHTLASLGICKHKGYRMNYMEYVKKEVQEAYDACHPYPKLFNVKHDD